MTLARAEFDASEEELLKRVANELKWRVAGEVRFDERARALYATDASPYEITPYGVVLPKSEEDVVQVLDVARRHGLPLLPRGGGTSLAGQTVGAAIVLDFSKYMTSVLELNLEERWVRVQPGVVRDELNAFLAPHGLHFTPDVSTTNRANIGGMIANNSAGTRSIKYGMTIDQVIALRVLLADGTVTELRELSPEEVRDKLELPTLEGEVHRTVHRVVTEHEDEIIRRFPKVLRRVGGYNLDAFVGGKPFNLAKLVTGSEGTLAIILDATLALHPVPRHRMLAMLHFETLHAALSAVAHINRHGPSAVEIMDDVLFRLGRANPNLAPLLFWLEGTPEAVLMVEFDGETEAEMKSGLASMQADPVLQALVSHTYLAFDPAEQARILEFRKGGLGIYATIKGDAKPTPFIEDAAIPPERLSDYIPEVKAICARHGVEVVFYGHASVGVIHARPLINLKTKEGVELFGRISAEVFELVKRYGGSWSGEHGDGLIRSYQNKNFFGPVIYEDFRAIKRAFDPQNLMNPGKIIDAPPMTEHLRYGPDYPAVALPTYFDFSADGGFLAAAEMCSGVGACRKTLTGTMCPSYMATRDEDHSTRGRANILREAMTGKLPGGLTTQAVYDVLDLCLECKGCKAECPSQVDVAKLKSEFLQHYYDAHGTPLAARAFGYVFRAAPWGRVASPLVNPLLPLRLTRQLLARTLGVDARRVMPRYAHQSFGGWAREHRARPRPGDERPTVALFADTWTMYHDPKIGVSAVKVLEALGYRVEVAPYRCCGRTLISKGLLKAAKRRAAANVKAFSSYVERGVPLVGLEPSCVSAFQDDYLALAPGAATEKLAGNVKMIDQFLAKVWSSGALDPTGVFTRRSAPVLFHGHCHQKATIGSAPSKAVLGWAASEVREVDSGCCGMAGSFGYSHYDVSMAVGERRLFPAVRAHEGEVVACGFSCRHQIEDGVGKRAKHVVEVLAEAL